MNMAGGLWGWGERDSNYKATVMSSVVIFSFILIVNAGPYFVSWAITASWFGVAVRTDNICA